MSKSDKDYDSTIEQTFGNNTDASQDDEQTQSTIENAADADITTDSEPTDVAQDAQEETLPLLALRDVVVYPHMQIALFVGRQPSVEAIEVAQEKHDSLVLVVSQKDSLTEDIEQDNLYEYGTVCRIVSTMPHDSDQNCIKVLIEGVYRVQLTEVTDQGEYLSGSFKRSDITLTMDDEQQQNTMDALRSLFASYAEARLRNSRELIRVTDRIEDLLELVYFIATRVSMDLDSKMTKSKSSQRLYIASFSAIPVKPVCVTLSVRSIKFAVRWCVNRLKSMASSPRKRPKLTPWLLIIQTSVTIWVCINTTLVWLKKNLKLVASLVLLGPALAVSCLLSKPSPCRAKASWFTPAHWVM